jgi:hypothetical protein
MAGISPYQNHTHLTPPPLLAFAARAKKNHGFRAVVFLFYTLDISG